MSDGNINDSGESGALRADVKRFVETSWIAAGGRWFANAIRHSALYRWLTAEPDPDVIVIDLRETWTVGPVIAVLDWLIARFEDAADGSRVVALAAAGAERTLAAPVRVGGLAVLAVAVPVGLAGIVSGGRTTLFLAAALLAVGTLGLFEDRSWAELRGTRPVELLVAALEPPEPPDSQQRQPTDDGETTQPDTDEPEGDPRHDPHQRVDGEVADDGARGEGDERDER